MTRVQNGYNNLKGRITSFASYSNISQAHEPLTVCGSESTATCTVVESSEKVHVSGLPKTISWIKTKIKNQAERYAVSC